ncbi:DUF5641 domain-containing protein [Trichonephila clavipes]|nr:DUF5641 domain-containing protein [Trichonephila clavipes]
MAVSRLLAMENKFKFNAELEWEYKSFMEEFEQLGHLSPTKELDVKIYNSLPHHAMRRKESITNKLGGVFDASCKPPNSLNSALGVRQILQPDIFTLLKIEWHTIPFLSAHFGGLWEAGIKSVKFHLRRVMGSKNLTFEELYTLLTQIEVVLNSRPLFRLADNDIDSLNVLTPSHFLVGEEIKGSPETVEESKLTLKGHWHIIQKLKLNFWRRWQIDYLNSMQGKTRWKRGTSNIKLGDVVIIKEDNLPPYVWPLGKVVFTYPAFRIIERCRRPNKKFNSEEVIFQVLLDPDCWLNNGSATIGQTSDAIRTLFETLLPRVTSSLEPTDLIRAIIFSEHLDRPISRHLMLVLEMSVEKIMACATNVLQSKSEVCLDEGFNIEIITIRVDP